MLRVRHRLEWLAWFAHRPPVASGQRVRNTQPDGGLIGDGGRSPSSIWIVLLRSQAWVWNRNCRHQCFGIWVFRVWEQGIGSLVQQHYPKYITNTRSEMCLPPTKSCDEYQETNLTLSVVPEGLTTWTWIDTSGRNRLITNDHLRLQDKCVRYRYVDTDHRNSCG